MTNFEFWKDRLAEMARTAEGVTGGTVAVVNDKPVRCSEIADCKKCIRYGKCTDGALIKWLLEEHIKKPKLTKKERMFCELVETGWIAKDKDGELCWFKNAKPLKDGFCWDEHNFYCDLRAIEELFKDTTFPFIKWEDSEPWAVEDLLRLEVE